MSGSEGDRPTEKEAAALLTDARLARSRAYAPYSRFPVGAALQAADGGVHLGANVENAAYPLCTCAERSALARAVSDGVRGFRAIAVAGPEGAGACMPCGSCRQLLFEFAPDLWVVVDDGDGGGRSIALSELLPAAFGPADLERAGRREE